MKTLQALKPEQVDDSTRKIFAGIKQNVGRLPNLYAAIGNSPQLLQGFLALQDSLSAGVFSAKENEAIALAVSEVNGCNYCLAAHSALGKMAGFSEADLIEIRKGTTTDPKLSALITLAAELTEQRGKASPAAISNFLASGYSHAAFAELIGMVALRSFTNYIFSNGEFEIDFPRAANLEDLVAA
jgi:uncharacterized peroxidase-related enzyme